MVFANGGGNVTNISDEQNLTQKCNTKRTQCSGTDKALKNQRATTDVRKRDIILPCCELWRWKQQGLGRTTKFRSPSKISGEVLYSKLSLTSTGRIPGFKGGTAFVFRKGIPHRHEDVPPLVLVEDTWVCIPIGNSNILLAALY
jgi:hypothetical protein